MLCFRRHYLDLYGFLCFDICLWACFFVFFSYVICFSLVGGCGCLFYCQVVDGLSVAQGPNYALAKRLQHWRAVVEYSAGRVVSSNIAPSTATLSVVSNR